MNSLRYQKNWPVIILIASLIAIMLMIIKHYNYIHHLQEKIDDHSEIISVDTV